MKKQINNQVTYYDDVQRTIFQNHTPKVSVVNDDTFGVAAKYPGAVCLNFASHKRPGGGYECVMDVKGPIKTQEEDLFRRSDLPAILDNDEVRAYYPLADLAGLYCTCTVSKDNKLNPITSFQTAIITVPAVVNPNTELKLFIARSKAKLILDIAADQNHKIVILGAWGCGVFNNDPRNVANYIKYFLPYHSFDEVIFAIPGGSNFDIFKEVLC
jgi:uncharacterized protein (TIGR02452 family)